MPVLSDKMLDVIGLVLVAIIGSSGAVWAWWSNRRKVAAEAKKSEAEAQAALLKAASDAERVKAETNTIATESAVKSLLESNKYLIERVAALDADTPRHEAEIEALQSERKELLDKMALMRSEQIKHHTEIATINQERANLISEKVVLEGRVTKLEAQIKLMDSERLALVAQSRQREAKVEELQHKYDVLKAAIINTFDLLADEFSRLETQVIDKSKVIDAIQHARDQLPKTAPLS